MDRLIIERKYYFPIVIAIVIVVSSVGVLDKYSDNYTNDAIIGAASTYAIARGINGIVSVLQTSTVHVGAGLSGSIAFGEVLDPINDMIERFSDVMSWALGSLVLQKILLGISAHAVFKFFIAASGFTLIVAFLIKNIAVMSLTARIFAILIFVRFSLVIVVSLNSIVDIVFIDKQITNGTEELSEFRDDVVQLKNKSGNLEIDLPAYEESIREDRLRVEGINTTILPSIEQELSDENSQLREAEADLEDVQKRVGWVDRLNPLNKNKKATEAKQRISIHEDKIEALQRAIEEQEESLEQLHEEIEVSEKRLAGEPLDLLDKIKNGLPSISGLKRSLSLGVIEENITETVSNVIRLSVLFILKTILIPLAFFFFFIKGVKRIWKSDLIGSLHNEKKLAAEPQ